VADCHLRRKIPELLECRFHRVIVENLAYSESVLWHHSDDLLHWDDLDVLLNARVFSARKVTLIRRARFERRSTLKTRGWNSGIFVRSMLNVQTASNGALTMTSCLDRNGGRIVPPINGVAFGRITRTSLPRSKYLSMIFHTREPNHSKKVLDVVLVASHRSSKPLEPGI
jgi:hypothetical protein